VTLLAHLVGASQRVSAASARTTKVRELADFLKALPPEEIETAVHYLSGDLPQGRIGIGHSALQAIASKTPAGTETLTIAEVDHRLSMIGRLRGTGSAARRADALRDLSARTTPAEAAFLLRLLTGELRQGLLKRLPTSAKRSRSFAATSPSNGKWTALAYRYIRRARTSASIPAG
jgi:DNA ligase-1